MGRTMRGERLFHGFIHMFNSHIDDRSGYLIGVNDVANASHNMLS